MPGGLSTRAAIMPKRCGIAGARQEAITQLAEAVKVSPEDPRLLDRLAEFHLLAGQLEEARHDAEAAIDLDPKSADAWMVRGRIMHRLGDNRQALADLHRALSYDPRNSQILHELAKTYLEAGQPDGHWRTCTACSINTHRVTSRRICCSRLARHTPA